MGIAVVTLWVLQGLALAQLTLAQLTLEQLTLERLTPTQIMLRKGSVYLIPFLCAILRAIPASMR